MVFCTVEGCGTSFCWCCGREEKDEKGHDGCQPDADEKVDFTDAQKKEYIDCVDRDWNKYDSPARKIKADVYTIKNFKFECLILKSSCFEQEHNFGNIFNLMFLLIK